MSSTPIQGPSSVSLSTSSLSSSSKDLAKKPKRIDEATVERISRALGEATNARLDNMTKPRSHTPPSSLSSSSSSSSGHVSSVSDSSSSKDVALPQSREEESLPFRLLTKEESLALDVSFKSHELYNISMWFETLHFRCKFNESISDLVRTQYKASLQDSLTSLDLLAPSTEICKKEELISRHCINRERALECRSKLLSSALDESFDPDDPLWGVNSKLLVKFCSVFGLKMSIDEYWNFIRTNYKDFLSTIEPPSGERKETERTAEQEIEHVIKRSWSHPGSSRYKQLSVNIENLYESLFDKIVP